MKKHPLKKFRGHPIKRKNPFSRHKKFALQKKIRSHPSSWREWLQFPNNLRIIPDTPFGSLTAIVWNKYFMVSFVSTFLAAAVMVQGIDLTRQVRTLEQLRLEREQMRREVVYWEDVVRKHQDYRDGYFRLALLEYRLGNREKAKAYLDQTLMIDPNYVPALNFAEQFGKGN